MNTLLKLCISRPLGVLAVYTALAMAGLFAWFNLPQELMPDLRFPQLTVVTVLPHASPEEIENLVSKPIEQILGTVKNVRRVDSVSKGQVSTVNVEFRWDTDMDAALLWVQEKLGLIQDQLPPEAVKPLVTRHNPFDRPVLVLSVTGSLPPQDIEHLVETRLKPPLEKAAGVSALEISGGLKREIKVELDAQKLSAHRLSILDVAEALRQRNVARSAGMASEGLFEYPVTVTGSFENVDGIREAIVRTAARDEKAQGVVRLGGVGTVSDGFKDRASYARYDGKDNITLAVYKRSEAYPRAVSKSVQETLLALRRQLPPDIQWRVVYDESRYIKEGISDVFNNVLLGGLLAYAVLWCFLRSHQRSAIVGLSIPLALLLTAACLYQLDMTLNLLTLGGLALGVGMLVDSSVVIMENITRHQDMGKTLEESVFEGCREVGGAVFFSVMTTVAAFAPIPFASIGVAQRVFTPICLAVILSQLASLLVGFTLVPALAALFLSHRGRESPGRFKAAFWRRVAAPQPLVAWLQPAAAWWRGAPALYRFVLEWSLRHPRRVLGITAGVTSVNLLLFFFAIGKEAMPGVDHDQFLMTLTLPAGTRLDVTDQAARRVENILAQVPETAHYSVVVGAPSLDNPNALGPHQAQIVVDLKEKTTDQKGRERRRRSVRHVMRDTAGRLSSADLEGGRVEFLAQGGDVFSQLFGKAGADFTVEVKGQDLKVSREVAARLAQQIRNLPGVSKVGDGQVLPALQTRYEMDEQRLARDGLSVSEVAETVLAGVQGTAPTQLRDKGKEIDIRLRLREEDRKDISALSSLMVTRPLDNTGHPLKEYGALHLEPGPSEIRRRDQIRTIVLSVHLRGRGVSDVLPAVEKILKPYQNSGDAAARLGGEVAEMRTSFRSLAFGFLAALILVYIVLVAQFNTLWTPFLSLVSVPLAFNGVAPALLLSGHTLNLMSGQGLMILSGIVVNNSLMLLEFIQQRRAEKQTAEQAVLEAGRLRLRPILMTVAGNIAGLAPLVFGFGRGAELQAPMAVTVVGGLLASTAMTLVVLPVCYLQSCRFFERATDNR